MHFSFDTYWPLALLLVIPYLWWVQRRTLTDLSPKHLRLAGTVRSAIVALIVLALMQPVIYRSGSWISVVYLLDVSQSVSPPAIQSAIQWVQQTNDAGHPDHARFIPFGANAAIFDKVEQIKQVQVASSGAQGSLDQSGTNIENAIDSAIRSFAPHHLKRLVLLSDGNENSGRMVNTLSRLKSEGIHVYTVPSQARTNHDVWVENILAPSEVTAEELFPLEAHIYSQAETAAEVEIKHGDKSLGTKKVQLIFRNQHQRRSWAGVDRCGSESGWRPISR
jgi:Ca-activated chloride channel homolog